MIFRSVSLHVPLYFAYGANMDVEAMRQRCPRSAPLGCARLAGFSFLVMEDGYGSVQREPSCLVHGLAWNLALSDVAALDRYEAVESGLYRKRVLPVRAKRRICTALVYVARSDRPGTPKRGYMEEVIASAEALRLPASYIEHLRGWLPGGRFTLPRRSASPHAAASGRPVRQAGQGSVDRRAK